MLEIKTTTQPSKKLGFMITASERVLIPCVFLIFRFWFLSAGIREAVQAGGPVDPTGRVQVAEETLSQSTPDLQRLLQTARHHRYRITLAPT